MQITNEERFKWLMRKDTEIGQAAPAPNKNIWRYGASWDWGAENVVRARKRAAIDAAIRAEAKAKLKGKR